MADNEEDILGSFFQEVKDLPIEQEGEGKEVKTTNDVSVCVASSSTVIFDKKGDNVRTERPLPVVNVPTPLYPETLPISAPSSNYTPHFKRQDKNFVRKSAGDVWVDNSLQEWPENDYRLFVGDLGIEVSETHLSNAFKVYKSFAKAKVVRSKHDIKSKGFGFVSFLDPMDAAKAIREMNGKYVGSRPIKVTKSSWKDRDFKELEKKENKKRKMNESLGIV